MKNIKRVTDKYSTYLLYSLIWLGCVLLINYYFSKAGKTLLWSEDGVYQHYVSYNYLCEFWKNLLKYPRSISLFNFSLGQGLDILNTLGTYDFTDPVCIITSLFTFLSRLQRYTLMIFVKLYLVGFSFIFYCDVTDKKDKVAVIGRAIAYTFSETVLVYFARHPNFVNWAYFLPFLLAGTEILRKKKNSVPLIIFVFLNAITNYYTFYMNTILSIIYIMVISICNIFQNHSSVSIKTELNFLLKAAISFLAGILLASFILLPGVYAYLSNSRKAVATGYTKSLWYYESTYYKNLFDSVFAPYYDPGYSTRIGLNAVMCIPFSILLSDGKKHIKFKLIFLIMVLMLCIPLCGRFMNGMGYATNRWGYAFPFFASVAFVYLFPDIVKPSKTRILRTIFVISCYLLVSLITIDSNKYIYKNAVLLMIVCITMVYAFCVYMNFSHINKLMLVCIIFGSIFQIHFTFLEDSENNSVYIDSFTHRDLAEQRYTSSSMAAVGLSDEFYRVETEDEDNINIKGMRHTNGTDVWWSLIPTDMYQYHILLNLRTIMQNCRFYGLDGRVGLMELAAVKYYTRPSSEQEFVPYGYEKLFSTNDYQVFENKYALPVGYTYTGFIDRKDFEDMSALEKEQAMLQASVLNENNDLFKPVSPVFKQRELNYEIKETQKVSLTDQKIVVSSPNGKIIIKTDIPSENNVYLVLKGFKLYEDTGFLPVLVSRKSNENILLTKTLWIENNAYQWYSGNEDFVINLGYGYDGENEIILNFTNKAEINYDAIQIISVPVSDYDFYAERLQEYVLKNVKVTNGVVSGTIYIPEPRILQFAIPYSAGWKAYVDGLETKLYQSNIMYMSILLDPGDHVISLEYNTPWLKPGFILSGITMMLIGFSVLRKKGRG